MRIRRFLLTWAVLISNRLFNELRKISKHRSNLQEIIPFDDFLDDLVCVLDNYDSIAESLNVFLNMEEHNALETLIEYVKQRVLGDLQES